MLSNGYKNSGGNIETSIYSSEWVVIYPMIPNRPLSQKPFNWFPYLDRCFTPKVIDTE